MSDQKAAVVPVEARESPTSDSEKIRRSRAASNFAPAVGELCEFSGDLVEVRELFETECIVLRVFTGTPITVPKSSLTSLRSKGRRAPDFRAVTPAEWEKAKAVAAVLNMILDYGLTSRDDLDRVGASVNLKWRQLQRIRARYRTSRLTSECLDRLSGPRPGGVRNIARRDVIDSAIDKRLEKVEATKVEDIVTLANDLRGAREGIGRITAKAVKRRLAKRGVNLAARNASGPTKYKESQQRLGGQHVVAGPLDEVQIDHTQMDLMVLDDSREFCLGRPWLTLVLDIFSRLILGFYISMRAPSMVSVARALLIAAMPKTDLLLNAGLGNLKWSASGKPRRVNSDNAPEFTSAQFVRACEQHGIEPVLRPLGRKHWGGHIERTIGTIMGALHLLPGTTFRNVVVRAKYDSSARAVMSHSGIIKHTIAQICEFNTNSKRVLQNWSPEIAWTEGWASRGGQPNSSRVLNRQDFYVSFLPRVYPKLQPDGLHRGAHRYFDNNYLKSYALGAKIEAAVDDFDTRNIFIPTRAGGDFVPIARQTEALSDNLSFDKYLRKARQMRAESGENAEANASAKAAREAIVREETAATRAVQSGLLLLPPPKDGSRIEVATPTVYQKYMNAPEGVGEGQYIPSSNRIRSRTLK